MIFFRCLFAEDPSTNQDQNGEVRSGGILFSPSRGLYSLPGGFVVSLLGLSLLLAAVSQCHVQFVQLQL